MINYDYDSFLHCHLADIFFRYFRGSKRVKFGGNLIARKRLASTKILNPHPSRSCTEQIYSQITLKLRIPLLVKHRN